MSSRKLTLGDFLIRSKKPIDIEDDLQYKRVTIRTRHQGISVRDFAMGSNIGTKKQFILKGGQFVLSKIDAMYGAFGIAPDEVDGAIITGNFWAYDYDKTLVSIEWLNHFTNSPDFYELCRRASKGITHRKYLDEKFFLSYEVNLPTIEEQRSLVFSIDNIRNRIESLESESKFQLTQLENLNQAILQEAVQGKLVKQDPDDEPASELLKRIKAEKAKLGKKEKPLPPIKPEEIPFEIPESWAWCRLGEICFKITDGFHNTPPKLTEGFPYIAATHVKSDKIDWNSCHYVSEKFHRELYLKAKPKKGEILVVNIGAGCGTPAIIDVDFEFSFKNTAILKFDQSDICNKYIFYYFILKRDDFYKDHTKGGLQPFLSLKILNEIIVPLPPLSEQKSIVAEIEKQFAKTKQLKKHIIANQQATEQLLKALLHQAFEVEEMEDEVEKPIATVIELKPTNVDYYRRTVLAAEIVWQLHKEPTLGHLKLQKLIYLCQKSADMQLPTNFLRQAMGPYDNRLMRSIDKQLKEKKWFEYKKEEVFKYQPLEKAGQHHNDFIKYFSAESESIQFIIDRFKTIKSDIVEIVATLYACMDNMLNENVIFSEALLFQRFYEWSEEKKKFSEKEVERVFSRMKETGIVPKEYNF